MEWSGDALILSVRPHGETSAIAEVFSRDQGRHLGLVRGGRSRRLRPVLQTGNRVEATWKARLADHLGNLTVELREGHAAVWLDSPGELAALASMAGLLRALPERDPHPSLYEVTLFVLGFLEDAEVWPALVARWEMELLDELGFRLDLTVCAGGGDPHDLAFVSPKTGRAVSAEVGAPYADRLLRLPRFLLPAAAERQREANPSDVLDALALTGFFLSRDVYEARGDVMPDARERMVGWLRRRG
ncbi:MAG: DNA repair protein RecO [Pseudomonadota bacterium]